MPEAKPLAHRSPGATPLPQELVAATAAGLLLHVAVGRGQPSAPAAALAVCALVFAIRRGGTARALVLGVVAGLATWLPSADFVFAGARRAGATPLHAGLVVVAVSLLHAGRLAVATLLATRLAARGASRGAATAIGLFAAEVLDPAPMPWSLGAATVDAPWLSAAADLGGPALAGLAIALAGAVVADAGLRVAARRTRSSGAAGHPSTSLAAGVLLAALVLRGALVTAAVQREVGRAETLRVAAVHTAVSRYGPPISAALVRAHVDVAAREADVVVLPEATFWFTSDRVAADVLGATFAGARADVIVGAGWGPASGGVNAMGLVVKDRRGVEWYAKSRPFPVGESNDLVSSALGIEGAAGLLAPSQTPTTRVFELRGRIVVPAICWEDLFADAGRLADGAGATWIAVAANDGWFEGSDAGSQHLLQARIRAVEARRAVVRATNLGATAIVDPLGGVTTRASGATFVTASIPLLERETVAASTRGGVSVALAALVLGWAIFVRPRASSAAS